MKKIALLAAFVASGLAHAADPIRIGVEAAYEPFAYKSADGKLVGFDIDMANALCAQMKAKCVFVEQEWKGIIPALNAKQYDAIVSSMSITDERKKAVAFSDKYEGGYSQLLGRKGALPAGTPESLKGKTIGVQQGTIQEKFARGELAKAGAKIRTYGTPANAQLDLNASRVDAILVEIGVGHEFLKGPSGNKLAIFGPKFNDPKYFGTGSGIAMRKNDTALQGKVNTALAAILKNGTYKKINDRYFTYNQYD